ncbi:MAG: DUF5050 domain-containing protein [Defluviitaleaceae bacterium]|nr:DUF5050 domain-containing protein [Defluviitaleaceae bacterium]
MSSFPKLSPYVVEDIIESTNFYTDYRATATHLDGDSEFIITEFYPSFMVRRNEEGALEATERFIMEFETALERFTKLSDAFLHLGEPFVATVQDVLHENNTVYIVRQVGRYKSLDDGLQGKRMNYYDAYVFLRPLIQSLVMAWKKGLLLEMKPGEICLTPYGQLIVDSMFIWEGDHKSAIKELTLLYYRLISGVVYNPKIPDNPSIKELGMPSRLANTITDILKGEAAYGSIDDFSKQLRTVIDAEGGRRESNAASKASANLSTAGYLAGGSKSESQARGWILFGVIAAVIILVSIPLVWFFATSADGPESDIYAEASQNAEVTGESSIAATPTATPFVRRHTAYAITDPDNPTVMLNGSFFRHGNDLYHRVYQGGFALARRTATGSTTPLATGVRPAFIQVHDNFVYFSDGMLGYSIRRVRTDGSGLETISNNMASFLQVQGNNLFYTNHSNRDFLYRLDLNTMQSERFLNVAAYETIAHGGQLFFVNGNAGFRIYSVPVNDPQAVPVPINTANSNNLRLAAGHIFYRDLETEIINRITPQGEHVESFPMLTVSSFDVHGSLISMIDSNTQELWLYNLNTQELQPTEFFAAYAIVGQGGAFLIDHNNTNQNRWADFRLPEEDLEEYDEILEDQLEYSDADETENED